MLKIHKTILLGSFFAIILTFILFEIERLSSQVDSIKTVSTSNQELSKLLTIEHSPKIVKCNFTGKYQVTQDFISPQNGAKCNDFEPRTVTFDNVISECTKYLDPNKELFLKCEGTTNPVRLCNATIELSVDGTLACEYWLLIQRVD